MKTGLSSAWRRATSVCTIAVLAAACASTPASRGAATDLSGTTWRLVEFESSDDAIGVRRPPPSQQYTMELMADGRVAMRLNCNRATGSWSAEQAGGASGTFTFGSLATTRAFCQAPSMDQEIARQSEFVRTFVLEGDRLYLNLMADGGNYVWERMP